MGYYLTIVAKSIDLQGSEFIQTVNVLEFENHVFVSWSPTPEQPGQNENWLWLAANTLRVSKQGAFHVDYNDYQDAPVEKQPNGEIIYRWEWGNNDGHTIIHLALPPNFIPEFHSLHLNMPAYAKLNRGRLCLGWLPSPESPSNYTINLIEIADNFEMIVADLINEFDAMKNQEPLKNRTAQASKLSAIYAAKIVHLEEQKAIYGSANVPFHIQYELDEAQKALEEERSILRK